MAAGFSFTGLVPSHPVFYSQAGYHVGFRMGVLWSVVGVGRLGMRGWLHSMVVRPASMLSHEVLTLVEQNT